MKPAIFLDKDGTIIPDIPYNVNPDLITLSTGVAAGLKALQKKGFSLIIVSNQAGIARGIFKENDFSTVQQKIRNLLFEDDIHLDAFYYCPHHPDGIIDEYKKNCSCRKPLPGLIYQAAKELNIDLAKSWMIGDILNDVEAGNRGGCKSILLNNGNETEWEINKWRIPNFEAASFKQAADYILDYLQ